MNHILKIFWVTLTLVIGSCSAQWNNTLDLFTGIKYGLVNTSGGTELLSSSGGNTFDQVKYNLGKGTCTGLNFIIKKDSGDIGLALGIRYNIGARAHYAGNISSSKNYQYAFLENKNLQPYIGMQFGFKFNKFGFKTMAGIIVPIFNKSKEFLYTGTDSFTSVLTRNIYYKSTAGLELQQQIQYQFGKGFNFWTGLSLGLLSVQRSRSIVSEYQDSRNRTLTQEYPYLADQKTFYLSDKELANTGKLNNPLINKTSFDKNSPTESFALSEPFSYLMISVGVSIVIQ